MDVVFFPRKDYNVEVCAHRLGKSMTYTEQSDRIFPSGSFNWIYGLAQEYVLKIGFFAIYTDFSDANFQTAKAALDAGKVWFDIYSMAPSIEDKIENGETISEGEFLTAYGSTLLPSFLEAIGRKPIALSYAYGNESFKDYVCPLFLGARNSYYEGKTDYGMGYGNPNNIPYSALNYKSRPSTIRWYDKAIVHSNFSEVIAEVATLIDNTKANGGWLNNFTHFHSVVNDHNEAVYEDYFDMLATKNANDDIYFAGYGEAVAYMVYRDMISRAVMYSPHGHEDDRLIIRLEAKNTLNVDTSLLQVPISIKFSTVGTPLSGKPIRCNYNLINLGSGEYIVEIPYAEYAGALIEKK